LTARAVDNGVVAGPSSVVGTANPPTKAMAYKKVARKIRYAAQP